MEWAAQESSDDTLSCSTTDACGWQVASASVPGAIHKRSGKVNQDALSWWSSKGEKAIAALCVSDGHGGSEYTRSDIGARCAVKETQKLLVKELLPLILNGSVMTDSARFKQQLDYHFKKELVRRWQESVRRHAGTRPISEEEEPSLSDTQIERHYGATLLAALLTPELHLYLQLGDGDILIVTQKGEVARPHFSHVDSHLLANETTSLCSKDAWRFVRLYFHPIVEKPPALVMLATDGYMNSFTDNAAFEQVAKDFHRMFQQNSPFTIAGLLPGWLEETSEAGSGDDISVIIAADARSLE